jgi:hypothetical protein
LPGQCGGRKERHRREARFARKKLLPKPSISIAENEHAADVSRTAESAATTNTCYCPVIHPEGTVAYESATTSLGTLPSTGTATAAKGWKKY